SRISAGAIGAFLVFIVARMATASFSKIEKRFVTEQWRYLLWLLSGFLIACLLVRPMPSFEPSVYSAYLGALHLLHHGGWPLIDVFSQYGLSFLAYLPLGFLLPFNHSAAALIAYAFNIAMLLVSLAMVYKLVGDRKFALSIASVLLVVVWLSFPYNVDYTPSVFGVRWLPTWVLALLLVPNAAAHHGARPFLWPVLALNIAAMWSYETHFVAVVIFGVHRALALRLAGASFWYAGGGSLIAIPLSLVGHVLFVVATLLVKGELPSYGIYFEFFRAYAAGDPNWLIHAKSMISTHIWLLFALTYSVIMFLLLTSFLLGPTLLIPSHLLIGLSVIATAGVTQAIYFVGRSTQPLLAFTSLPLYTIFIVVFILFIDRTVRHRGWKHELVLWGIIVFVSCSVGYAWDRIRMDYSNSASLLALCLASGRCKVVHELYNVVSTISEDPPSRTDTPDTREQLADLTKLYLKWRDQAPEIAMVAEERTRTLVKLGVQDALRANYLFIDTLSPTLMKRHARALARMPPGSIV